MGLMNWLLRCLSVFALNKLNHPFDS